MGFPLKRPLLYRLSYTLAVATNCSSASLTLASAGTLVGNGAVSWRLLLDE